MLQQPRTTNWSVSSESFDRIRAELIDDRPRRPLIRAQRRDGRAGTGHHRPDRAGVFSVVDDLLERRTQRKRGSFQVVVHGRTH